MSDISNNTVIKISNILYVFIVFNNSGLLYLLLGKYNKKFHFLYSYFFVDTPVEARIGSVTLAKFKLSHGEKLKIKQQRERTSSVHPVFQQAKLVL